MSNINFIEGMVQYASETLALNVNGQLEQLKDERKIIRKIYYTQENQKKDIEYKQRKPPNP